MDTRITELLEEIKKAIDKAATTGDKYQFTLAYINEMMDLEGLELHQDGESYPNDYFESLHYDFISRCNEDEWPE